VTTGAPNSRGTFSYAVTATFDEARVADEWIAWLRDGHIADVQLGGALNAEVVRRDPDPLGATGASSGAVVLEVRYRFASRESFDCYVREFAPKLRAEGAAKFPIERGVRQQRAMGVVVLDRG